MNEPPPIDPPDEILQLLARHPSNDADRVLEFLRTCARPCTYVTARRVADEPLRRSGLGRLVGRSTAQPQLGPERSKFGGRPWVAADEPPFGPFSFIGQINFAEIPNVPSEWPSRGIRAIRTGWSSF
ncbi:MAG: hypothetical protein AB7P03_09870 [Kofleriaceae bacterium]